MTASGVAIDRVGLLTSLGDAAATCAALRAAITNPTNFEFMGSDGEWVAAHQAEIAPMPSLRARLARMAGCAIRDCLADAPFADRALPVLLCVAETGRPGRTGGLEDHLLREIEAEVGLRFHPRHSTILSAGRPGVLLALRHARVLLAEGGVEAVLVVAVDSLLHWETLLAFDRRHRLLTKDNANGFLPGEAAGAVLLRRCEGRAPRLVLLGTGSAAETATLDSGEPLRAEGLTRAIRDALAEADCPMHGISFRITDHSGEQYFFREASLALSRTLRERREEFDLWHPAEGVGECGAAAGAAMLVHALVAFRKGYAKGPRVLLHASGDDAVRAAAVMEWAGAQS